MPEEEQIDKSIDRIRKSDSQIKYGPFNRRTEFDKNAKLFPNGKPNYKDVKQGYTDLDCFFLDVVAGMAKSKPGKLLKCFPEYDGLKESKIDENFSRANEVKILFYKTKRKSNDEYESSGKVEITIEKTALRSKGAPWVRLLEKAYAVYRAEGCDAACPVKGNSKRVKSRIIDGINGGDSASVIVTLTGNSSRSVCLGDDEERSKVKKFSTTDAEGKKVASYNEKVLKIFKDIQKNLEKGNIVTASADRRYRIYSKGLFLKHCYTVIGTNEKNSFKYVVVRNPYANRSRVYKKDSKGVMHSKVTVHEEEDKKGVSELELNDFFKYFKYVETEDAVPENPSSESSLSKD